MSNTVSRPQVKKECAVLASYKNDRSIYFSASERIVDEHVLEDFGAFMHFGSDNYCLRVSPRFDFDEVLAFINSLG